MRTPIIVAEGNDLSFFASLEDVEGYLEAIDVDNGEYIAYDADGRPVPLSTKRLPPRKVLGMISVRGAEVVVASAPEEEPRHAEDLRKLLVRYLEEPRHAEDLRKLLVRYLGHWEPIPGIEQKTLQELIDATIDRAGMVSLRPRRKGTSQED